MGYTFKLPNIFELIVLLAILLVGAFGWWILSSALGSGLILVRANPIPTEFEKIEYYQSALMVIQSLFLWMSLIVQLIVLAFLEKIREHIEHM